MFEQSVVGETSGLPPILHMIVGIFEKFPFFTRATTGRPYGMVSVILPYNHNNDLCA